MLEAIAKPRSDLEANIFMLELVAEEPRRATEFLLLSRLGTTRYRTRRDDLLAKGFISEYDKIFRITPEGADHLALLKAALSEVEQLKLRLGVASV